MALEVCAWFLLAFAHELFLFTDFTLYSVMNLSPNMTMPSPVRLRDPNTEVV